MLELREALGWLSAGRLIGDPATRLAGFGTDTRTLVPGALFIALRGERFDAHDLLADARTVGAAAVMVERWVEGLAGPVLWVPDTRRALGELAAGWRRRFALPLIAVTGSNGKTTVKEMIAAILAEAFGESNRLATRDNLNNEIGVALTLAGLRDAHRAAVVELGMNRPGEIAWLARIAAPTVALVNNAQREHQEFLHSVAATAHENGQAIAALSADGIAVFPADDAHSGIWRRLAGARRRFEFGLNPADADLAVSAPADARPPVFDMTMAGEVHTIRLAIDGAHNVRNALAAAACALAIGIAPVTIASGLARFRPVGQRLQRMLTASGAALIDDSYNANPDSVRAAIDVLAACAAPRILILGDMGEVGEQGPQFHHEVGVYARERGVGHLLALGEASRASVAAYGDGGEHFDDVDALIARARELAAPPATVLVKGSRFMRMLRVVAGLAAAPVPEAH
ncbi:MAG: UDP-N-acetylmuramoyl-tripeptide--D-alanyl-D-alanine ligase [Burkholderiaceae bacterium]